MKVTFDKLPSEWIGVNGPYYWARAVSGKQEYADWLMSAENLAKFLRQAEQALKEQCSEVLFHNSWTKKREEIIATAPEAFYGFPHGAVSSSNAGGNGVTDGETSP